MLFSSAAEDIEKMVEEYRQALLIRQLDQHYVDRLVDTPEAVVLAHPECTGDVLELADFVGSTSQIIDYATNSDEKVFLICTEMGVFYELLQKNPEKKFFSVGHRQFCPNMKKIHLDSVLRALENPEEEVEMDEAMRQRAVGPLARMLELAK